MKAVWRVIQAEWFKGLRKRRLYVLAGLWWVLLPVLTIVLARVLQTTVSGSFVDETGILVPTALQAIASPNGAAGVQLAIPAFLSPSAYVLAVTLLTAAAIGEERSHNMWKTTLVAEPSRLAVLWGKLITVMLQLGLLTVGAFLTGVLAGAIGSTFLGTNWSGDWGALIVLYVRQWLHLTSLTLLAALLIFVLRNVTLGIVATFFLPVFLEGLYSIWRATVGFQPLNRFNALFQALELQQTLEALPRWFFTNNLYLPARSVAEPLTRDLAANATDLQDSPFAMLLGSDLTLSHAAWVMALYGVVFAVLLSIAFVRRDVS